MQRWQILSDGGRECRCTNAAARHPDYSEQMADKFFVMSQLIEHHRSHHRRTNSTALGRNDKDWIALLGFRVRASRKPIFERLRYVGGWSGGVIFGCQSHDVIIIGVRQAQSDEQTSREE